VTGTTHSSGTKELIHIQEGTLTVEAARQPVLRAPGDAVALPGAVSHSYGAAGEPPTRFSPAISEPGAGSGRRSQRGHG
jgi:quercetin dioxygenase-like cupin family protein